MHRAPARWPIVAVTYSDGARASGLLKDLCDRLLQAGARCAGFIQRDEPRPGRSRCDMALECVHSGQRLRISEDRGPGARGCRLDAGELVKAMESVGRELDQMPDLLIVNKFGKTEAEGGGFRPLIAEAIERGIPVLIAVPWRNIDGWRIFATDLAKEYDSASWQEGDRERALGDLGFTLDMPAGIGAERPASAQSR